MLRRLVITITRDAAGVESGQLVSFDENGFSTPLTTGAFVDSKVKLEVGAVGGVFVGDMSADGTTLTGKWLQYGRAWPLTLKREVNATPRTQSPGQSE